MSKPPISLERYRECVKACHKTLRESDDGLTAYELEKLTGFPRSTIKYALSDNPLFYVDRWKIAKTNKIPTCVWEAVLINNPGDCPRPDSF